MKECKNCNKNFSGTSDFCKIGCKVDFQKEEVIREILNTPMCYYCGTNIKSGKFCTEDHQDLYEEAKKEKRNIYLKIDDKTTIATKKYDDIPQVVAKYVSMSKDYTRGSGGGFSSGNIKVGNSYISGDIW